MNWNKKLILISFLFYGLLSLLHSQEAIIVDPDNSIFFIKTKELSQLSIDGGSFSAIEIGDQVLWVSYDEKATDKTYFYDDGSRFKLHKTPKHLVFSEDKMVLDVKNWNPLKSEKANYGPISLALDQNLIFITASQSHSFRGRSNNLGIYYQSGLAETERSHQLPFIDIRFNYCHPAWDSHSQRLYFSSDMDNPSGKMNLFYSEYKAGNWTDPLRLDIEGNFSNSNQIFPFVNQKGLFFSSDVSGGYGGLDIYFAQRKDKGFLNAVLLAPPINSEHDDFGIWFHDSHRKGYFSSNRNRHRDAIFAFDCGADCFSDASISKSLDLIVSDKVDLSPISGATVHFLSESRLLKEIEKGNLQIAADGGILGVSLSEDWMKSLPGKKGKTAADGKVLLEKRSSENIFYVLVSKENYLPIFEKLKFEDGFSHLFLEWELVPDCFPVTFMFVSEEGSIESDVYVRLLDIKTNDEINLIVTNEIFRACLLRNQEYQMKAVSDGYESTEIIVNTGPNAIGSYALLLQSTKRELVSEGTVLELSNIYYEYNSHEIVQDAAKELEELAAIMKLDTTMVVELRAHTDSRGSAEYNLQLSTERAESAKKHLLNLDIHPNRILISGRGHTELRNHCSPGMKCSEEEHAFNRRTEVFVIRAGPGIQAIRDGSGGLRFIFEE